ncbi:LysM peptidoglycan-binding domain-containing protein [Aggregicoccus sp. 17bor-14]|uniref:LysM peptidoglycan-binding domain-containing protein n=1 Tax=Myxococcaceae TaxID=31 RepID=UPI00129C190D|nr:MULTISPECIES: LysM peptidoglycan-binding domain-containing protein [Myxococcaceae]MBF5044328.1 LysM peptidoglycan-binding domain-containing protein [Simulacricoccus sp. 17bor-14]MRI90075.1 LysM peptidoglycan-binding domain-containing protein [Aggregicoccus sp. 17bor-14]
MPSLSLLLLALSTAAPKPVELEMPPPPPGMRELTREEKTLLLSATPAPAAPAASGASGSASEPGDDEESEEVEKESAELEELRALEAATVDPGAVVGAEVMQTLRRLGFANPLRQRMLDALQQPALREDATPGELPTITDLATFDVKQIQDRYDIPVEMQPLVAQYIQFFRGPGRKWFRSWMARSTRFLPVMQPILEERGLPKDTVYLAMIESGFSAHAYSWAHAAGPWQFVEATGKQYGLRQDFWVDERRDPIKATHAAARFLKDLHDELGHWYLAWAGYNTGSARVRRVMTKYNTSDFWQLSEEGKGLAKETQHYVPKLIACALMAKHPKAFGFTDAELQQEPVFQYDEVKLPDATDLDVVARAAGVSVKEVQDLNPELKRWCTPPASSSKPYVLRLPKGSSERFAQNFAKVAPHERLTFKVHKVKRGDTLSGIAKRYGSAPEAILQVNRLRAARALKVNAELVIPVPNGKRGGDAGGDAALARKVAQARRSGLTAVRPEDEVPAGTASGKVAQGATRTQTVNGRTRVSYAVQDGDSLWTIAQRFGVSVDELRSWNSLGPRKRSLKVGSELLVWPAGKAEPSVQERGGTVVAQKAPAGSAGARVQRHALASGETLWNVAQRYNVSVEDLKRWNKISNHRAVRPGQMLVVSAP